MARGVSASITPSLNRLRSAFFTYFFGVSAFFAFAPLYYERLGFSAVHVGVLVAMGPLISLVAQPLWGHISDLRQGPLGVIKTNLLVAAGLGVLVPFAGGFQLLALCVGLLMFFQMPIGALLNGVTLGVLGENASSFGRIRLFGSVGFTSGVLITGWILQVTVTRNLFYAYAFSLVVTAAVLWSAKDYRVEAPDTARVSPLSLLRQGALAGLLLYAFCNEVALAAANAFLSIYIDRMGGTEAHVGAAHMIGSLACMPIFFYSKNVIDRLGPRSVLMIGTAVYALRWLLTAFATAPWHVMLVQVLHGPGFALTFTAAVALVHALTPLELRSSGQTALASLTLGLGGMVGGMVSGFIVDQVGIQSLFFVCAVVSGVTLLTGPLLLKRVAAVPRAPAA